MNYALPVCCSSLAVQLAGGLSGVLQSSAVGSCSQRDVVSARSVMLLLLDFQIMSNVLLSAV
jgi:hypothetical protein